MMSEVEQTLAAAVRQVCVAVMHGAKVATAS